MMEHDFKRFPELNNAQMQMFYFDSPHKQITESFEAFVTKVIDGDTVRVEMAERDFDFPVRMIDLASPELKEKGGPEAQKYLESLILGKQIEVIINPSHRVGKWGRLLGKINYMGFDVALEEIMMGHGVPWEMRDEGKIPEMKWS